MSEKVVTIGGTQSPVRLERDGTTIRSDDHLIELLSVSQAELEIRVDGRTHLVPYVVQGSTVSFSFDGELWFADVVDKGARAKARHRDHSTAAPMPGVVLKLLVKTGDVVGRGAPLLILEAMKMEHQIVAPRDATVSGVHCKEGELVQPGVELVTFEAE
ncbi:MAG TPA: biotin/lipoyl-containing protein [Thermoanaerobaculia bacterium]